MNEADVLVTVQGDVADVKVRTPGIVIEVRDYDVDDIEDDRWWTDEVGGRCVRYFTRHDD